MFGSTYIFAKNYVEQWNKNMVFLFSSCFNLYINYILIMMFITKVWKSLK